MKAIFPEDELPEDEAVFLALNAELSKAWPNIALRKDALPDAAEWDSKPNKRELLVREWPKE